jgi:predicted transcriptional regulator
MTKNAMSIRLDDLTKSQLDELTAKYSTTQARIVATAIDRMYQQEITTMNTQTRTITQSWLQSWIDSNRPDLGLLETNSVKGFYKLDAGPAQSFMGIGQTWRQVAAHLGAIEVQDAA